MENDLDPLAQFGLDAIDLRWTLRDIAAERSMMINQQHLAQLIDLCLVEMREDIPYLTNAGQDTVWWRAIPVIARPSERDQGDGIESERHLSIGHAQIPLSALHPDQGVEGSDPPGVDPRD